MNSSSYRPPRRILIASANPLFGKGLQKLLQERWSQSLPEMRLTNSMATTLATLEGWSPDLVVVDYDDRNINRAEFLNHFMAGNRPMQVMLVSLLATGEVTVYDRHTLTTEQARDWFENDHLNGAQSFAQSEKVPTDQPRRASFFTLRWIMTTLLVLAAMAVFVRLGFWQLDRLAQRRASNARISAQLAQPVLNLNKEIPPSAFLEHMQYRSAVVTGVYDYSGEVVLRNRVWQNQLGVHILTPLKIQGSSQTILVDRGWIPFEQADPAQRAKYEQDGLVEVSGMLRGSESKPTYVAASPTLAPGQTHQDAWNYLDLPAIIRQTSEPMLPVYLQEAPDTSANRLPYRSLPSIDLTEGPHLGYAIQWFAFALILGAGYPFFVRRQLAARNEHPRSAGAAPE